MCVRVCGFLDGWGLVDANVCTEDFEKGGKSELFQHLRRCILLSSTRYKYLPWKYLLDMEIL